MKEWCYLGASVAAGLAMLNWHPHLHRLRGTILVLDAAGLGVFAAAGTLKALAFGASPVQAPLLGMLNGIGGGIVRDLLVNEIAGVLRSELYAIAALAGATLCFTIPMIATRRGWHLPTAKEHKDA